MNREGFIWANPASSRCWRPGEKNTDPYRPTPDELYARGKAHFDAGRYAEAAARAGAAVRRLHPAGRGWPRTPPGCCCLISIKTMTPARSCSISRWSRRRLPSLILTFDQLLVIGKAYRDINEYERAIIVWRGLIEASYLEDARVGELLRQRGKTLEAMAYLHRALADLSQHALDRRATSSASRRSWRKSASDAFTEPNLRRELAAAGVTRSRTLAPDASG